MRSARNLVEFAVDGPGSREPSSDLKVAIGRELGYRRSHRGLTGVKLADLAGVSAGALTMIEKGDMAPSIQSGMRIADALEVPASMFFHHLNRRPSVNVVPAGKGLASDRSGKRHRA